MPRSLGMAAASSLAVAALLAAKLALAATTGAGAEAPAGGKAPPANGLQVKPGLWEFTTSLPEVIAGSGGNVHRTCVRDRTITPRVVMARQQDCRIGAATVSGQTARWKMRCDTPAGPVDGTGTLRTNGVSVAGSVEFAVAVGAFEMPVSGTFRGRRVGDCR